MSVIESIGSIFYLHLILTTQGLWRATDSYRELCRATDFHGFIKHLIMITSELPSATDIARKLDLLINSHCVDGTFIKLFVICLVGCMLWYDDKLKGITC